MCLIRKGFQYFSQQFIRLNDGVNTVKTRYWWWWYKQAKMRAKTLDNGFI